MARSVEFLMPPAFRRVGGPMLEALHAAALEAGYAARRTEAYDGLADWLVLYGYGAPSQAMARDMHRDRGGHVFVWDLGYFGRKDADGYLRTSLNQDHPQDQLDDAPNDGSRWKRIQIELREDADPDGPIILVGMGPKSHRYLGERSLRWEATKLEQLRRRFPGREVIFRPKPKRPFPPLRCRTDPVSPIDALLRGASLVVCRHSNVAIDAAIAGVPFECEDGAARWLMKRPFTPENRLEFLRRLAWFQWRADEAREAWRFMSDLVERTQCV